MTKVENMTIPRIAIEAWFSHAQTERALKETFDSRLLHRKRKAEINRYDLDEIIHRYTDNDSPDLLILEIDGDAGAVLSTLDKIANVARPKTNVIVICQVNDVKFYHQMMEFKVSGYLLGPTTTGEVINTLTKIYAPNGSTPKGHITAVIGAAGGVGSSVIAQNIAWNMAERHKRQTLLVDADVAFGSALLNFNQSADKDIADALWAENVDETFLSNIIIPLGDRLELLPSPASLDRATSFDSGRIQNVLDAIASSAPNIVIDLPHEWGNFTNHVIKEADEVIVVGAPDIIGLRNTKTIVKHLLTMRSDIRASQYVINNQGVPKRLGVTEEEFRQAIGVPPIAVIPYDPQAFSVAIAEGQPFSAMHESSPITDHFYRIAARILDEDVSFSQATEPDPAPQAGPKILNLFRGKSAKPEVGTPKAPIKIGGKSGSFFGLKLAVKK